MKICNPILGKCLSRYGLLLNDKGLYRKIRMKNNEFYKMFLTNDKHLIGKLFDIDTNLFEDLEYNEQIECIYNSKYFNTEIFIEDEDDFKDIRYMSRYVSIEGDKKYLPLDTDRIVEVLQDSSIKDRIEYLKKHLPIASKMYNEAFKEMKEVLIENGYDKKKFNEDIMKFMDNFKSKFDMYLYFYENTMEDIIKKYLSTSK